MGSPIRECGAISRAKSEPLRCARSSRLGRTDPAAQHLETLDAALEAIAGLQRPDARGRAGEDEIARPELVEPRECRDDVRDVPHHRSKSTRLNSSHVAISYAVFCLKKKRKTLKAIVMRYEPCRQMKPIPENN